MVTVSMSTVICKDWLGGVPGAPAGCIPGHEIFFGARSLVVRSDSGCCRFNRATVVSSFSTAQFAERYKMGRLLMSPDGQLRLG